MLDNKQFNIISNNCKYGGFSIKDYSISEFEWTCRNKSNLTVEGSWGKCNYNSCPLFEKDVIGRLYMDGECVGTFNKIKFGRNEKE